MSNITSLSINTSWSCAGPNENLNPSPPSSSQSCYSRHLLTRLSVSVWNVHESHFLHGIFQSINLDLKQKQIFCQCGLNSADEKNTLGVPLLLQYTQKKWRRCDLNFEYSVAAYRDEKAKLGLLSSQNWFVCFQLPH